ncbi:ASCH domain-containing protein [Paenibacillus sp. D2_2]|uniref:ASCH domain-containing protein n=1 Tax=Paenibacillus sp. D2_2 TaxID=3073092 RepID=UPI00281688B4|nr:ASCH domain-containing protein [Paenibacillus sp. D2_2]WMT42469.1 ASCH domain-containing protein [Paenibacillus sp. D2_2]
MKVITIRQPWATLVALGEKQFETRSWRTDYRGELAIHAGKAVDKTICLLEPYRSILQQHGYAIDQLPTGAIIAVGRLERCLSVEVNWGTFAILSEDDYRVEGTEYVFGDYTEGRYVWKLDKMRSLERPLSATGRLGLWNLPDDLLLDTNEIQHT